MRVRQRSITRVCSEILEIAIRLYLRMACVLVGYGTAKLIHGNTRDLAGGLTVFISAAAAFVIYVLLPIGFIQSSNDPT